MKATLLLLAVVPCAIANALLPRAACNNDNCARAITGTQAGASRSASRVNTDCASFIKATAYPSAVTITITSGSTSTSIPAGTANTVVRPTSIPAYVQSSCGPSTAVASRFASACSCAGYSTSVTTTAATPTATVVVPTASFLACPTPIDFTRDGSVYTCSVQGANTANDLGTQCYCFKSAATGQGVCGLDFYCDTPACTTDADCASGFACVGGSACSGNRCSQANTCANDSAPARLFRKRATGLTGTGYVA